MTDRCEGKEMLGLGQCGLLDSLFPATNPWIHNVNHISIVVNTCTKKDRSWMKLCANKGWLTVERPNLGIKAPFFGDRDFPNEMHIEIGDLRVNHV